MKDTSLDLLALGLPMLQQLERYEERLDQLPPRVTHAALLEGIDTREAWQRETLEACGGDELGRGRAVVVYTADRTERRRIAQALARDSAIDPEGSHVMRYRETASRLILSVVSGRFREVYGPSSRGEGKTFGGLECWRLAGWRHRLAGYPGPLRVAAFSGTFSSQKAKLVVSALKPEWFGAWQSLEDDHVLRTLADGTALTDLLVTGVDGPNDLDRLRAEFNAAWGEEVESAGVESVAVPESAVSIVVTSLRMPGPVRTLLITANFGSEGGWPWRRYVVNPVRGSTVIQIPNEERATPEDRAQWREQLAGAPAFQRRLIDGAPALIVHGQAVLEGIWNRELHVSRAPLSVLSGQRLILGHDGGLSPATVVLQWSGPQLQVLAGLQSSRAGTQQHLAEVVEPWLARHAPDNELEHWIDPSMSTADQSNLAASAARVIKQRLGGLLREGPVKWDIRRDTLCTALGRLVGGGIPALLVSAGEDTEWLRQCAEGRWHYPTDRQGQVLRDGAEKDEASHVMDALTYAVCGAKPWRAVHDRARPAYQAIGAASIHPINHGRSPRVRRMWMP